MGRKRSIVIDMTGPLLTALVTAARVQDSTAGETLINRIAPAHPTIRKGRADRGYRETSSTTQPDSASTLRWSAALPAPGALSCNHAGGQ
ncbi:transposase [Streptomyces tauricus]|nr:transposase [Streptomyces tauricus]